MITNIDTLNAYSYNSFIGGAGSKLYVPVSPASVIYAQFDHISGVAARGSQPGVSIKKIQILNTLIDHLTQMKSQPQPQAAADTLSDEAADALIQSYQSQLQTVVQQAKTMPYALAGVQPQPGVLLNIQV